METGVLNKNQRRFLQNTLLSFEKSLKLTERLLENGCEEGILYKYTDRLTPEQHNRVRTKIRQALNEIENFASRLGLEKSEEDISRLIKAQLTVNWADLMTSRAQKLKGYGKVTQETAALINPTIDQLARITLEINQIITPISTDDHPDGG